MVRMDLIHRNLALSTLAVLLVGAGVYWLSVDRMGNPTQSGPNASSTNVNGVAGTGQYSVETVGVESPKLGAISINASLDAEVRGILRRNIEAQYEILRKEPSRVDIWLQLGVNRKIGGDFEGAIQAWEYVAAAAPTPMVATARGNLGDLYMYFLKDYAKAKTNLSAAIQANPNIIEYYRALFYLEKDINKNPTAARTVVEAGLKANPGNPDLEDLKSLL